jgi:integrase
MCAATAYRQSLRQTDAFPIGEAFSIVRPNVALCSDFTGMVDLGVTKGGKHKGAKEFIHITKGFVGVALVRALLDRAPGQTLLRSSVTAFRTWFAKALLRANLSSFNLKPYSLRRGGATWCFQQTFSMPYTVERSRWSDVRTARIYVTGGVAMLSTMQLPAATEAELRRFARNCIP